MPGNQDSEPDAHELRFRALEEGREVTVDLVGFDGNAEEHPGAADLFPVGSFRFVVAWTRRLTDDERRRLGALLAALPADDQARCHIPAFGLHLDADTPDATRASICFKCNNIYFGSRGKRTFDGFSSEGRKLLAYLLELAPAEWVAAPD